MSKATIDAIKKTEEQAEKKSLPKDKSEPEKEVKEESSKGPSKSKGKHTSHLCTRVFHILFHYIQYSPCVLCRSP